MVGWFLKEDDGEVEGAKSEIVGGKRHVWDHWNPYYGLAVAWLWKERDQELASTKIVYPGSGHEDA